MMITQPTFFGSLDGCGDWTNPCDDVQRIAYRLEWYAFQYFDNKSISIETFLKIIYQSWLQIIMIEQKQGLDGVIFKTHGVYGTEFFIAFGGSADSRAKSTNAFYADRRFTGKYNNSNAKPSAHSIFDRTWHWVANEYFVRNRLTTSEFLTDAFSAEVELYTIEVSRRRNASNPFGDLVNMIRIWVDPIGTIIKGISKAINEPKINKAVADAVKKDVNVDKVLYQQQQKENNEKLAGILAASGALAFAGYQFTKSKLVPAVILVLGGAAYFASTGKLSTVVAKVSEKSPYEGKLLKASNEDMPAAFFFVFLVKDGKKHRFFNKDVFARLGYKTEHIEAVTMDVLSKLPIGDTIK